MGYFDGFTANLFRTDIRGQHVFPLGRKAYAVTVGDERRIKQAVKTFQAIMLVVLIAGIVALGTASDPPPWLRMILFGSLWVAAHVCGQRVLMASLARSLTPLEIGPTNLIPVTRGQRLEAVDHATGRPTLWALALLSLAMTVVAIWVSVLTNRVVGWCGAAFFALCTASLVRALRHS